MTDAPFGDRLSAAIERRGNSLCVGLDPHLSLFPAELEAQADDPRSDRTAAAVWDFLSFAVEECAGRVPAVKPQAAFFVNAAGHQTASRLEMTEENSA